MAKLRKADDELMNINPNYQNTPRSGSPLALPSNLAESCKTIKTHDFTDDEARYAQQERGATSPP
jgi:hypothetical protein